MIWEERSSDLSFDLSFARMRGRVRQVGGLANLPNTTMAALAALCPRPLPARRRRGPGAVAIKCHRNESILKLYYALVSMPVR